MNKRTTALLLATVLCMNTPAIAFAAEADTAETAVQTETEQEEAETAVQTEDVQEEAEPSVEAEDAIAPTEDPKPENKEAEQEEAEKEIYEEPAEAETEKASVQAQTQTIDISLYSGQDLAYADYEIEPFLVVKYNGKLLREGTDYEVSYSNNINVGTACAHVTGKGSYSFSKDFEFEITKRTLTEDSVQTTMKGYENRYNSHAYGTNRVYVSYGTRFLNKGTEYTIEGESDFNEKKSGAVVTIRGTGNFTGEVIVTCPEWEPMTVDISGGFVYGIEPDPQTTVKIGNKVLKGGRVDGPPADYYVTTTFTGDRTLERHKDIYNKTQKRYRPQSRSRLQDLPIMGK